MSKLKDLAIMARTHASKVAVGASVVASTALTTAVPALAADGGTSVIDATLKSAITTGANNLLATVSDVVAITVPVTITAVGIVIGCRFALKQLKSVLSAAS